MFIYRSDVKKVIRDSTQDVPFYLRKLFWREEDGQSHVYIMEPSEAEFLMSGLTSTYDKFEPSTSGFMQHMTDRIFGDVHEGIHVSEEMLLCDTLLLGIGQVALVDGKVHLRPPESGYKYILTQITKTEIIRRLENRQKVFKFFTYITALIGAGIVVYIVRKHYKAWKLKRENERFLEEMKNVRLERDRGRTERGNGNANGNSEDDNTCVICLTNPREVILLNCGHICACAECVVVLPRPMMCPVCRQAVDKYLPVYNP